MEQGQKRAWSKGNWREKFDSSNCRSRNDGTGARDDLADQRFPFFFHSQVFSFFYIYKTTKKQKKTAPRSALSCTEIVLKDPCTPDNGKGPAVISSRTLSFPASFGPEVAYVRKGARIALLETSDKPDFPILDGGKNETRTMEVKHDFVCGTIARNELAGYYNGTNSTRAREDWMWCTDGLNRAGLSCATQYQGLVRVKISNFSLFDIERKRERV